MMDLFSYIENSNLTPKSIVDKNISSNDQLRAIVESLSNLIPIRKTGDSAKNPFTFVANEEIGGGFGFCTEIKCRSKMSNFMAYNASLYADQVYLLNPIDRYLHVEDFTDDIREDLANELRMFQIYQPLIEARIIQYCDHHLHYCASCYAKFMNQFDEKYSSNFELAKESLINLILDSAKLSVIDSYDGRPAIQLKGLNKIIDHDIIHIPGKPSKFLTAKQKSRNKSLLTKDEVKKHKLYEFVSNKIIRDWLAQDYFSKIYDASSLTNREIDFELMRMTSKAQKSDGQMYNLAHEVPIIRNLPISKLLELRFKNGEAFSVYRSAVQKAMKIKSDTENDVSQEVFNDIIRPELEKIENTLKSSKKILFGKTVKDVLVGASYVGIGLAGGFLPNNIGAIVTAVGGINFVSKLSDNIQQMMTTQSDVRSNPYYFLWKLQTNTLRKI